MKDKSPFSVSAQFEKNYFEGCLQLAWLSPKFFNV